MSSQNVSVFGIGNMGAALAKALLNAGFKLTIWNRTADRPQVKSLVEAGATYEGDLRAAIRQSDGLVLFCVVDYNAMYKLLESAPADAILAGKTVVNVTNGTPKQAVAMQSWIKARGAAHYLDGSVLVTPEMVATPHALLVYSGEDRAVFDARARPVVEALGAPLYLGGEVDAAAAQDIAMLAAMYGLLHGAFIGFGILQRSGRSENQGADAEGEKKKKKIAPGTEQVTTPIMAALASLLTRMAKTIDAQNWSDNGGNPLGMMLAGLDNITEAARDVSVNADGLAVFADAVRKAAADGHADSDFSVTSQYLLQ
ncbi:hypothetical protein PWT90_10027 [Aphanocladium album]|nr:hypothetical protein PWT90_10027 [Aphanocladium album]